MQDQVGEQPPHSGASQAWSQPSSSRMLTNYLADIEQLLDEQRWESALRDAIDLPQIAAALADPDMRSSAARCKEWCAQWIHGDRTNDEAGSDYERVRAVLGERADQTAAEAVPTQALRRLRLRRHSRTAPHGFKASRLGNAAPAAADAMRTCTAVVEGARRWYAHSACHDPVAQANLARLAVLR